MNGRWLWDDRNTKNKLLYPVWIYEADLRPVFMRMIGMCNGCGKRCNCEQRNILSAQPMQSASYGIFCFGQVSGESVLLFVNLLILYFANQFFSVLEQ